jgi:endogenous inhibitor of DNA gyrase (YacG/DUF329 family)
MMTVKQCPTCNQNVSLTQWQWDLGAELPKDCPRCSKTKKKKDGKTRKYFREESKPDTYPWLKKGA